MYTKSRQQCGPQSEVGVLTHPTIYIMTYSSLFIYSNRQLIRKPLFQSDVAGRLVFAASCHHFW